MKKKHHAFLCVWRELALALFQDGVTTDTITDPGALLKQIAPDRWAKLAARYTACGGSINE